MSRRSRLVSLTMVSVAALLLSGCSVLENFGIGGNQVVSEEPAVSEEPETSDLVDGDVTDTNGSTDIAVPTCDTIYSADQVNALLGEVRVNIGETSEGNFGYGTTNQDLVAVLKDVRRDLRISCTWYLPASESVSVTSVSIISSDVQGDITRILGAAGASREDVGSGALWIFDSTNSDESPDFIATEAHFVTEVPCPSSLADSRCAAWVTSNYSFGVARTLTVDAATQLGVFLP